MSDPVAALDTALYAALNVPSLVGLGKASAVYRFRAPTGAALPYVVFGYSDDGGDTYTLGGGRGFVRLLYGIKVVAEGLSASTAAPLAATIDSLVTGVALSVSGYTLMVGRRLRPVGYEEDGDGGVTYQHLGGQYEFVLDPT